MYLDSTFKSSAIFSQLGIALIKSYFVKDVTYLKHFWSAYTLKKLNFEITVIGKPLQTGPLILFGNHLSYIDIPLLVSIVPSVTFLSKKEVASWPLIGRAARRVNTIFVDRSSKESRRISRGQIGEILKTQNQIVSAFPAGTTSLSEAVPWRTGLFETAFENAIPIQAFRINYSSARKVAYIDNDTFIPHLLELLCEKNLRVTIEFSEPTFVRSPLACSEAWRQWTQEPEKDEREKISLAT